MATRPKAVIESRNGEKFSPITIAKNVLTDDGQNLHDILSDKKEDMMTPTIENSSSMFKVGQGDNVDYSSNVVNGAYESMVLKGKTMVNYIQESSSQDIVLPYEFEDGQYVTINDTKESGALGVELKGQTLVNTLIYEHTSLFSGATRSDDTITLNKSQQWSRIHLLPSNSLWTPNETYTTILYDVVGDTSTLHMCSQNGAAVTKTPFTNNKAVFTMGTGRGTNQDNRLGYIESSTIVANETVSFKVVILKGNYSDVDVPYFTGMASCKMPILKSVNQMFDYSLATKPSGSGTVSFTNNGRSLKANFEVTRDCVNVTNITLPAGTYEISYEIRGAITLPDGASLSSSRAGLSMFKSSQNWYNAAESLHVNFANMNPTNYTKAKKTITFDESVTVAVVYHGWNNNPVGWCEIKDIRIVPQGKSSILSLPEEVVLRSLPNGVCDTFNTRTGVYTQRIGEAVVNGSENWQLNNTEGTTTQRFFCNMLANSAVDNNTKGTQQYLCDRLRTIAWNQTCELGVTINGSGVFVYNNSIEYTVSSVKQWLSQNPVKLQYELTTPVVTKINLSSTLKSWNTTTHIYSEIPENTLYPILSHSNPTYPVILKPSTKYSIVANSYTNNHTSSTINFNLGGATVSTTVGSRVTTITTPSTLSNELLTMSGRGNKLNNVMVIEGEVVGDEPYFEGICDVKSPILSNVGKNLFDVNGEWHKSTYSHAVPMFANGSQTITTLENGVQITTNNNQYHGGFGQFINIGGINKLRIAFTGEYTDTKTHPEIVVQLLRKGEELPKTMNNTLANTDYNPRKTSFKLSRSGETASKVISTQGYECAYVHLCGGYLASMSGTYTFVAKNICIEDADQVDIYEPYKSNTTTFEQKDGKTIVLRSLPNGVCDTLNVETGEYVQRIGEIVLNGSEEGWTRDSSSLENSATNKFYISNYFKNAGFVSGVVDKSNLVCHKLSPVDMDTMQNSATMIYCIANSVAGSLNIRCPKSADSTNALKTWLRANPINVHCELTKPIVSTIDVQGFPYAYTNGHVQLSSGSIEQSLTPKVEYSVVINRNGQIRSNQKMVERHQKQLDRLQAMILTNLVNTQYEQTLTNLKYDLKNVREEVK